MRPFNTTGLRSGSDMEVLDAVVVAYMIGSDLGCAALVHESGKRKNESASFWTTLAGSTVGTIAGIGLATLYAAADEDWDTADLGAAFLIYTGTQSAFAVLGHFLSRRSDRAKIKISWLE